MPFFLRVPFCTFAQKILSFQYTMTLRRFIFYLPNPYDSLPNCPILLKFVHFLQLMSEIHEFRHFPDFFQFFPLFYSKNKGAKYGNIQKISNGQLSPE